ncbi:hypothetical protein ARMSODRAFT_983986 [Armillaria solidipes]|uniref:Uncharacterized protein n=1 Tax=Armillaria solidipes TaxID=1076256 RepID=A0A2H3AH99_9AGAR|nr:hypothetical protein ARMSODRAFT_983986 [Armillaria solidipes]
MAANLGQDYENMGSISCQAYFYTGQEILFKEGSWAACTATRVLSCAEKDRTMNALWSFSEWHTSGMEKGVKGYSLSSIELVNNKATLEDETLSSSRYLVTTKENAAMIKGLNAGAAIACGDVLGWITRKLVGVAGVHKLLEGPSFIAVNLNHVAVLAPTDMNRNELVVEVIIVEEETVLIGFIPSSDQRETPKVKVPMRKYWEKVVWGIVFTLTMEEWGLYIAEFKKERNSSNNYTYTANDSQYGVDLIGLT